MSMAAHLSRRDWVLLPLVSLLTTLLILLTAEWIARKLFRPSLSSVADCLVLNDPAHGVYGIPNCQCSMKADEGIPVEYKFDPCGYRTALDCGKKLPGSFRIVLVGSSFAFGMHVPLPQTFASLLTEQLSRISGRKVEVYNEGIEWGTPNRVDLRFEDILAAQPDLILWPLTPWDIQNTALLGPPPPQPGNDGNLRKLLELDPDKVRLRFLLQHALYSNQSQYLRSFLLEDARAGFMRIGPTHAWQLQLLKFSEYATDVERKARAAGVPLVFTLLPQRAQAVMISTHQWPTGFDPYKIGDEVSRIVQRQGGTYIDLLHALSRVPDTSHSYLPVDGHPNAVGHAMFASLLTKGLTGGEIPALSARRQ